MNILSINCSLLMFKYSEKITKFGVMFLLVLALKLELFRFIQGVSTPEKIDEMHSNKKVVTLGQVGVKMLGKNGDVIYGWLLSITYII